jgi:hypothetical protein
MQWIIRKIHFKLAKSFYVEGILRNYGIILSQK